MDAWRSKMENQTLSSVVGQVSVLGLAHRVSASSALGQLASSRPKPAGPARPGLRLGGCRGHTSRSPADWAQGHLPSLVAFATNPADELDDDAQRPPTHHDDLARCGPGKQLNHAGML
jgi:hypothetical protein